jgi:hypothetical protein
MVVLMEEVDELAIPMRKFPAEVLTLNWDFLFE